MSKHLIRFEGINYLYPNTSNGLFDVSVSFERGKRVAILGPNGAGKSTLLFHLNALFKPNSGLFYFDGQKCSYSKGEIKSLRRCVGLVFQDPDMQIFSSTVYDEIVFGPYNLGLSRLEIEERVDFATRLTGLSSFKDRLVHHLSYGEKKLLAIASVLAMRPSVFVLDEPMAFLDEAHRSLIINLLNEINALGSTIIFSTHDIDFAYNFADCVVIMKEGRVFADGDADSIFRDKFLCNGSLFRKPFVLELFEELVDRGFLSYEELDALEYPITKDKLFSLLSEGSSKGSLAN